MVNSYVEVFKENKTTILDEIIDILFGGSTDKLKLLGRNGGGVYIKVHPRSWKKFRQKLKILSSRRRVQRIKPSLEKIKVYARGMAELLWDSKHEKPDRGDKRVAVPSNPNVYMETMEETKDQTEKSNENGNSGVLCTYDGK